MSLQVWLPLNGNLENQGLSEYDIITLGTISWVDGKLCSSAMKAGTGSQVVNGLQINTNFKDLLNGDYSVSVWIKPYGNHVHYNGTILSSGNWNTTNKRWAFGVNQDNTKVDVLGFNYNTYIDCAVPVNEWTNIICTCGSDRIIKLYKNGEYIGQRDGSNDPAIDSDAEVTCVGRETYASGYFSFNGAIQDLRLYDHALSTKEVKELSKGLVLHYKLSNEGLGENLAHNTYNLSPSVTQQVEYKAYNVGVLDVTNGETVTVSFDLDMTVATGGSGYLLVYNTNEKGPHQISGKNSLEGRTLVVGEDLHERLSVTTTISNRSSSEIKKDNDFVEFYSNYSTENEIHISNIKVERGTIATPWLPNPSDTEYAFLDYNDTAEYDHSGFGNDGTKTNITTDLDTPRYSTSYFFDGDTSVITVPYDATAWQTNFTLNLWFKKHELGSKNYETLFGGPSGFEMDTRANNATTLSLYMAYPRGGNVYSPFNFDEWYMVTLVNDGTNELYYINGELVKTIEKKAMPTGNYFLGAWQTATKQNFKGWMSDFRIYATPLSEKDIKELYTVGTAFDKQGRVMTYEVVEV